MTIALYTRAIKWENTGGVNSYSAGRTFGGILFIRHFGLILSTNRLLILSKRLSTADRKSSFPVKEKEERQMEFKSSKIDQLMAEADDLIRQIYSEKIEGMGAEQRTAYEQ